MDVATIKSLELPDINPGDTIYYEISPGFIVPATIIEIQISFGINNKSCQYNKSIDKEYVFVISEGEISEPEEIRKMLCNITSQGYTFYWIDEFVGHSLEIGDEIYKTLNEAFANSCKINKRLAKRRHKKVEKRRKRQFNWLKSNNKWINEVFEEKKQKLLRLNKKPIYVRK